MQLAAPDVLRLRNEYKMDDDCFRNLYTRSAFKVLSGRFCGGFDFLTPSNEYIVSDTSSFFRNLYTRSAFAPPAVSSHIIH